MSEIDRLTPSQEQQLIEFRAKWLAIGRATGAANMEAVTPVIIDFYARIGKAAPRIVQCESPMQAQLMINIFNLRDNLGANLWDNLRDNLRDNLWDNLGDNLRDNLRDNLWDNLGDNLRDNLGDNLRDNLWDNLWANLWANLRANLRDNLGANLWANLRDNLWDNLRDNLWDNLRDNMRYYTTYVWGSYDAYWIAYYLFIQDVIKPDIYSAADSDLLAQWAILAQNCGFWYPFEGVCFVCDRPSALNIDDQGRLHSTSEAAMQFADGYALYQYHGVTVPEWIITQPETITVDRIDDEPNAEVRRAMIEIFTPERYIADGKSQVIHSDETGILYAKTRIDDESITMVRVKDPSTEREYWLRVPPLTKTAREGVAWTFGMTAEQYRLAYES